MNKRNGIRWLLLLTLGLGLLGVGVERAQAFEVDKDGVIAAGEVVNDDVMLMGAAAQMDGTVNGNLITSAQHVVVNGTVNGDAIVYGDKLVVNGVINGNLFVAGSEVEIGAQVKGSVYSAGGGVTLQPGAVVERNLLFVGFGLTDSPEAKIGVDVLVMGYQAVLTGEIGRDLRADVAGLELAGKVGRDVTVYVGKPEAEGTPRPFFFAPGMPAAIPAGLRVAEKADIGGKLKYTSSVQQDAAIKARPAGGQEFVLQVEPNAKPAAVSFVNLGQMVVVGMARDFLTLMALGSLALWLFPQAAQRAVTQARAKPLPAAGWGIVVLVGGYLIFGLGVILTLLLGLLFGLVTFGELSSTILGLGLSSLGAGFAGFSLLVAHGSKLVVACGVGQWAVQKFAPRLAENRFWGLALGALGYVLIRDLPNFVPVLGWLAGGLLGLIVTLIGLGAIWLAFQEWRAARAKPADSAAPAAAPEAIAPAPEPAPASE